MLSQVLNADNSVILLLKNSFHIEFNSIYRVFQKKLNKSKNLLLENYLIF